MIVVLESIWRQSTGRIMMVEVETEEEAFAEIRRFLEINNIPSNVTYVSIVEEHEYLGEIIPRHKQVGMCQHGCREYPDPYFGIYYDSDQTRHKKLGSLSDYKLSIKTDYFTGKPVIGDDGYPILVSEYYTNGNKWYSPLYAYLTDLEQRRGGESCH